MALKSKKNDAPPEDLPSPRTVSELMALLAEAARGIEQIRVSLDESYAREIERIRSQAAEQYEKITSVFDDLKASVHREVNGATENLERRGKEVDDLETRLTSALGAVEAARLQLRTDLEALAATTANIRADQAAWQARAAEEEAKRNATIAGLGAALDIERNRISQIESYLHAHAEQHTVLEERIKALENKKVLGIF